MDNISKIIKQRENDYVNGYTEISKYVSHSQYETINRIEAYLNSVHISGETDALGREKPFFNIVTAAANIWFRATDIDRKNIRFKSTKLKNRIPAFIANIILQDWMKRTNYGAFLNEWGRVLARYGSAVTKYVERDGVLYPTVIPWNKLITDNIDFYGNPIIEKYFLTKGQLLENPVFDKDVAKSLLDSIQTRKKLDGTNVDNYGEYIEIYEIQGKLPLSLLTDKEEDKDTYVDQIHIVSFSGNSKNDKDDIACLYKGKLKQIQYHLSTLIKEDGRTLGIGAVEHLFQSQWMVNHTQKNIKDYLDLISKVVFQTADTNFVGRNALNNIETGDIMIHSPNTPLTLLNNNNGSITSLQSWSSEWQGIAKEITSTPDSISGNTMPSGTAYRQVAILNQESHSLFELMTENKGLDIEESFRKFVIGHIISKMDTIEEVGGVLDSEQIKQLDAWYVNNKAMKNVNRKIIDRVLEGETGNIVTPLEQSEMIQDEATSLQTELSQLGNERYIKPSDIDNVTWKEILKDFDWEIEVEVTNEQSDKESIMTSLTTILQALASNPQILENPMIKRIFEKIIEISGAMSPIELSAIQSPVSMAAPNPNQLQAPVGGA